MKDFRQLRLWKEAHRLVLEVYPLTKQLPAQERFALTSQVQRAVTSIPINIAEGCGRGSDADFSRFIQISLGSAKELEYLLLLCQDLEYLEPNHLIMPTQRLADIQIGLGALLKKLRATSN